MKSGKRSWVRALWLAGLCAMSSLASANAALAIDSNQGDAYGVSYDEDSMRDAEFTALRECGRRCKIVLRVPQGCGAYAGDVNSGVYGTGLANSGEQAQRTAKRYCRQYGGTDCQVRAWACNSQ